MSDSSPLRILIVEDDPMMQLGLTQALDDYPNFTIVGQANDGYAGVDQALALRGCLKSSVPASIPGITI